jgi:hypothetical protein
MIVRLMGEGQYRIDDGLRGELNALDLQAGAAVDSGDEEALHRLLAEMAELVRGRGARLPDDDLSASDLIILPADLTLEEARELFSEEGLIPDLPA